MKRSSLGRSSLAAMLIGLGAWSAGMAGTAIADSTYQPWSGATQAQAGQTSDQKLQKLVTDLNALINKAEDANAADPNFLADLKKLSAQYPVTAPKAALGGAGTVFLYDNFADGDYTANPTWKVSAGAWKVDTKGATTGLSSTIGASSSNKITGNDVLKAILGTQQQQAPQSTYASIYTAVPIANTFRMTMKFSSGNKNGALNIGPYQGASASSGYRLVYQPGNETGMVLQRIVGNQVTQVGSYNDPINLEDGKTHELTWQRESTGKMRVYLDNQQLIIATDTQIQGNLDGWLNVNQGGAYWIKEIKVTGL
ncbi:MAG TPA: hypothetical protein VFS85_07525 [Dongiaceae bacterium]|nr:hypothetical protein [Dongiaceae bacterium]